LNFEGGKMSEMICANCGKRGIHWMKGSLHHAPFTYCPNCGGMNCQKYEEPEEHGNEKRDKPGDKPWVASF